VSDHPSGLDAETIEEIQNLWDDRITMGSLSQIYGIPVEMVRKIIAAPRKE